MKEFSTHIYQLDHYAQKAVEAERKDKLYTPKNAKVITLLRTYDSMKTDERIHHSMSATHWEKFYKRFANMKRNRRGLSAEKLNSYYLGVKASFLLMNKEYLEEIGSLDCRKLCEVIYHLPKRWNMSVVQGELISELLTNDPDKMIARKTVKGYLQIFKEFMRYAVKEEIIQNSLNDFIDMPIKTQGIERSPFTFPELHKIFNPQTYPTPYSRNNQAKFWVPIIALYHGCRLNEICQMDLNDVVMEKGIPCFNINDNGEDKQLKNSSSKRIIPIHSKLIDMGFLYYVQYQRREKQIKLFPDLSQIARGRYSRRVQAWFTIFR